MHTKLFVKRMVKMLLSLKYMQINLNNLKTMISISMIKKRSERFTAVEENKKSLEKDGKKWKTMENTSISLYCINFFIVIKKLQKIDKNCCTDLILHT